MTRLGTLASSQAIINRLLLTQTNLFSLNQQTSSQKKAQVYSGLETGVSQRLLDMETTRDSLERFQTNNEIADLRLKVQETTLKGINDDIGNFRKLLNTYHQNFGVSSETKTNKIQDNAFRMLLNLEGLLNTEDDRGFIFGGGRATTEPIDLGLTTKAAFQSVFNGSTVTVPTTRNAALADFTINNNPDTLDPNFLTFTGTTSGGDSRISSSVAQFQNADVGGTINISGTLNGVNDGTYTIAAVDPNGFYIDVVTKQLTDETGAVDDPLNATFTYPISLEPLVDKTVTAEVSFDRQTNTITAAETGALSDIPVGSVIAISGTTSNNNTFTVAANDGTNLTVQSKRLTSLGGERQILKAGSGNQQINFVDGGAGPDSITAPLASNAFAAVEVGQRIKIQGTGTNNDGRTFTVASISANNNTLTLSANDSVVAASAVQNGTIQGANAFDFDTNVFTFAITSPSTEMAIFTDNGAAPDTIRLTGGARFTDSLGNLLPSGTQIVTTTTMSNNATHTIASVSADGTTATLIPANTLTNETTNTANLQADVTITFNDNAPDADTITASPALNVFSNFEIGQRIRVGGAATGANRNQVFTIAGISANGATITLSSGDSVTAVAGVAGTLSNADTATQFDTSAPPIFTFNAAAASNFMFNAPAAADIAFTNLGSNRITLSNGGSFVDSSGAPLPPGTQIQVAGTGTANDGRIFTITSLSNNNRTADLAGSPALTITDATAAGSVTTVPSFTFSDNNPSADTITLSNGTFTDSNGNPLRANTRITITGSANNNGTFTIASLNAAGNVATLVTGDTLTNENLRSTGAATVQQAITFTEGGGSADSITLSNGDFRDSDGNLLAAGTQFTVLGTGTTNDGLTFTIQSVSTDGSTATLMSSDDVMATGSATTGFLSSPLTSGAITANSYYNGDNLSINQRISNDRLIEFDVNASNPAFEKAIRAARLILQGEYGSEGGLDQNPERVTQALYLLNDALDSTNTEPPPFGEELNDNVDTLRMELAFNRVLIKDTNKRSEDLVDFFETSIAGVENADRLESITNLLNEQRLLETSYQTFSRVRQLSLLQFL